MTNLTTAEIRQQFIDYFTSNGHTHVPASRLIPDNDPSLMFVNSGMVQFKKVFTGLETRSYQRATSAQKSVRAGGKHNDLDNVGYTARHHTFFEMMGNFSFGDYFKEQAIYYAWELLTKNFGIPKDRLYVTIYHTDDEAAKYWQKIAGLSTDRIIRINTADNFWSVGDTGPCGPCSEIFYDHGEHIPGGLPGTAEAEGDRYIEIWNMVFMQFEQISKDHKIDLPKKSIDTGLGLERLVAVMQGVNDNYDIDLFREIIGYAETIFKVKAQGAAKFSYRVIADHLRAIAFLIAEGIMPQNDGRGYVLRRIMRRSMRHSHLLGAKEPIIYQLLPKLIELMSAAYPELAKNAELTSQVLKDEEERFKVTLSRGLNLLSQETANLPPNSELSGNTAFMLYDTYGFPLDLTADILKNRSITIDISGFNDRMQAQKIRARKSWLGSGDAKTDQIWFDLQAQHGSTEYLGYALNNVAGTILALIKLPPGGLDAITSCLKSVDQINIAGEQFILVANQTVFYGESGGQKGDIGIIESSGSQITVIDTLKYLGAIIGHLCRLETGQISTGEEANFKINQDYHQGLKIHHSATHILHSVLRKVLGHGVTQKGSLVASDHLRFDFSYTKSLPLEIRHLIEDQVNQIITDNSAVVTLLMNAEHAIQSGAMALFGEKYGQEVRVVSIGSSARGLAPSVELCGGTHVSRTGEIGSLTITYETAAAAGIRRIEAICGLAAVKAARHNDYLIKAIAETLKTTKDQLLTKIVNITSDKKALEKELSALKITQLDLTINQIAEQALVVCGARLIYRLVYHTEIKLLRSAAQQLSYKADDLIIVYISRSNDKLSIIVAVSANITGKFSASFLATTISQFLGGSGGGGQVNLAQASGTNFDKLPEVKSNIISILQSIPSADQELNN